jgi:leader peptidase (prepilin peptidase)/N-methyltransferase
VTPLAAILAVAGAAFGFASDRLAVRWPEHDDDEHPAGRPIGWRTLASAAIGAFAFGLFGLRFEAASPILQVAFGAWLATLVVGFAIDLDQRLLPDEFTIPAIPIALILAATGLNPLAAPLETAVIAAVVIPIALYLFSIPFGAGAFGLGDVKLLAGVGLMLGFNRAFTGLLAGLLVSGLVLVLLLVTRRIGRQTFVPFGPFLIFGALWGLLVQP